MQGIDIAKAEFITKKCGGATRIDEFESDPRAFEIPTLTMAEDSELILQTMARCLKYVKPKPSSGGQQTALNRAVRERVPRSAVEYSTLGAWGG